MVKGSDFKECSHDPGWIFICTEGEKDFFKYKNQSFISQQGFKFNLFSSDIDYRLNQLHTL